METEDLRADIIDRVARELHTLFTHLRDYENDMQIPQYRFLHGDLDPIPTFDTNPEPWRSLAEPILATLHHLLPTHSRYAVANPVTGEPRFINEPLDKCTRLAAEFDTRVIRQYLGEWSTP